jgi:hypothetical protein
MIAMSKWIQTLLLAGAFIALIAAAPAQARPHMLHASAAIAGSSHQAMPTAPSEKSNLAPMPAGLLRNQKIVLHRHAGRAGAVLVSVGIPFAPGVLRDPRLLRILDAHGKEVPAAVQTTLKWYAKDGSVRAVRAQFQVTLSDQPPPLYFAIDRPRQRDLPGRPYADGLVADEHGLMVPAAVATLTAPWLCASLIAGPQQPASPDEPYANYVSGQFRWAGKLPVDDSTAWLFDRPSTLYKAYVRTGRADYLQAAIASYRFYMKYLRRDGLPSSPLCAGGWTRNDKPCDVKYVYVEPILLALALSGDDSQHDARLVDNMMSLWQDGGWNSPAGPYTSPSKYFTERLAGLGLVETVSGYELTGDARYLKRINDRVGWLYDHQRNNPDGLGDDGSWRSSWNLHENDSWDPATDVRGASPWMSENIIDGLWHTWLVTHDKRIPPMITGFGRYLERYGWIRSGLLVKPHDWRHSCTGSTGQIAWYWSSAHASTAALQKIQESEGWYSDAHNVELVMPVAAAYYFETDPKQSAALKRRLGDLATSYNADCAAIDDTLRRFNWNNRGSGVAQWMEQQTAGSGAAHPASPHAAQ